MNSKQAVGLNKESPLGSVDRMSMIKNSKDQRLANQTSTDVRDIE